MIKTKSIDHINLTIKSVEEAKKFYQKHFGMKVFEEYAYENSKTGAPIKFLLIGISNKIMLCLYEHQIYKHEENLSHIGINVENFEESLEYCKKEDILDKQWGIVEHKNSKSFYVVDPNGLNIEISENFGGGN